MVKIDIELWFINLSRLQMSMDFDIINLVLTIRHKHQEQNSWTQEVCSQTKKTADNHQHKIEKINQILFRSLSTSLKSLNEWNNNISLENVTAYNMEGGVAKIPLNWLW